MDRRAICCVSVAVFAACCASVEGFGRFIADNISVPVMSFIAGLSARIPFPAAFPALAVVCALCALLRRRATVLLTALFIAFAALWMPCVAPTLQETAVATEKEARNLCAELVDGLNAAGRSVLTIPEILAGARETMNAPAAPKAARYPELMRAINAAGIYIPLTGEALVDVTRPCASLPFTAAHELAHMLGIGDETEANLATYEACTASGGAFGYSARLWALKYAMSRLQETDWVYAALPEDIAADLRAIPYSGGAGNEYAAMTDWLVDG